MAERDDRGMLRWKCWGRGDGSGGGDGGDGDCGARSHAACRGGPPWYAGEESSRAGRIFFASSALHRALGERQRFWFLGDAFLKRHFVPQEIDPLHQTVSPRATFISFRNVVAAPRYPDGRYAAGYRGLSQRGHVFITVSHDDREKLLFSGKRRGFSWKIPWDSAH
jgi:hypothetical protein